MPVHYCIILILISKLFWLVRCNPLYACENSKASKFLRRLEVDYIDEFVHNNKVFE